jgi:hypothetical protein
MSRFKAVPIFEQRTAPLKDLEVTTVSMRKTGGTDHESFDEVGIPGFQFIQDPRDYETRFLQGLVVELPPNLPPCLGTQDGALGFAFVVRSRCGGLRIRWLALRVMETSLLRVSAFACTTARDSHKMLFYDETHHNFNSWRRDRTRSFSRS